MAIGWIWIQSKSMLGSHVGIYQMQKDVNFPSGWTNWCRGPGILAGKDLSPRPGSAGCSLRLGKIRWNNLEYFDDFPRNFHQWMGNMDEYGDFPWSWWWSSHGFSQANQSPISDFSAEIIVPYRATCRSMGCLEMFGAAQQPLNPKVGQDTGPPWISVQMLHPFAFPVVFLNPGFS